MDWLAIASTLGERDERPLVLLDRSGRVKLLNRAMEQVLGRTRFELENEPWWRFEASPERELETRRWIAEGLRGTLRTYEVTVSTKAGDPILLQLELSLVGRGTGQGLLMVATRIAPAQCLERLVPGRDVDYDVVNVGAEFGLIVRLAANGRSIPLTNATVRCYTLLHNRTGPCEDCPMMRGGDVPWPRTLVRHLEPGKGDAPGQVFEITTAELVAANLVRVRVRSISETMLGEIHETKVKRLADDAGLSAREREVLKYLLLGRTIQDIGKLIGISARTVKHHQAKVLQKLGADSRADLVRVIL
jgi:PAS domain S-box-containing protein